jgi:hypothetical protein
MEPMAAQSRHLDRLLALYIAAGTYREENNWARQLEAIWVQ